MSKEQQQGQKFVTVMHRTKAAPPGAPDGLMFFVASTDKEDRDGDVIVQTGWDFKDFDNNPVFLYQHKGTMMPIGKIPYREIVTDPSYFRSVEIDANEGLVIGVEYDDEDELAMKVKGKYERGFMNAVSVGFRALEPPQFRDSESNPWGGYLFTRCALLEVSAVTIPSNTGALMLRGMGEEDRNVCMKALDREALAWLQTRGLLSVTDFPRPGDCKAVALENSSFARFPVDVAQRLKRECASVWRRADTIAGDAAFDALIAGDADAIKARESWASATRQERGLRKTLMQIKRLLVDDEGVDAMVERVESAARVFKGMSERKMIQIFKAHDEALLGFEEAAALVASIVSVESLDVTGAIEDSSNVETPASVDTPAQSAQEAPTKGTKHTLRFLS